MFIGHFGAALAAKRAAPRVPLGFLILASTWIDLIWPIFLLLGIEQVRIAPGDTAFTPLEFTHYPYTHSLLYVVGWGMLLAGIYVILRRRGIARRLLVFEGAVIAALVVSHWVLDWLTHRPDLPLYPEGPRAGLGLWNSVPATIVIEGLIFLIGVILYARLTRPLDRIGRWSFLGFVAFAAVIYIANITGPPPPSAEAIGWVGLAAWLFPVWGWWIERHRRTDQ